MGRKPELEKGRRVHAELPRHAGPHATAHSGDPCFGLRQEEEPDAVQEVALVEDQVIVEVLVRRTVNGSAAIATIGAGVTGAVVPPPPPPPPQE